MILIKSEKELVSMRRAGKLTGEVRQLARDMLKPGVTTGEIDRAVHKYIIAKGGTPSFLNYNGFPKSLCISINEEVIHGIPGSRKIKNGDVVSIDVGVVYDGFHGDCADTVIVGEVPERVRLLAEVTRQSFFEGLKFARKGHRVSDISHAIQSYAESHGFSVVRSFVGHGVGASLHEPPEIPNFGQPGHGPRLIPGMTLAIEPMINMGGFGVHVAGDGWTVVTNDKSVSAHYENTVLITSGEPELLTYPGGGNIE